MKKMLFREFASYLNKIEQLSSRNEITVLLAELISKLTTDELPAALYFLQGRIAPQYIDLEFNFSTKLLIKGLALNGYDLEELKQSLLREGDIGLVLEKTHTAQSAGITVRELYTAMVDMATVSGKDSQAKKINMVEELFKKLSPLEAKYAGRLIAGKLRLGVSDKTIMDALSWAVTGDKSLKPLIEKAYGSRADLPVIAKVVLENSDNDDEIVANNLTKIRLQIGIPLASKLVEREKTLEDLYERLQDKLIVQPKYDGLRVQIHFNKQGFADEFADLEQQEQGSIETVRLFSRNMTNITAMFPDIVAEVEKLTVDSAVIDTEAIGYDAETGVLLPFQDTIQRKRKYGVSEKSTEIPVRVYCFDLLALNGASLLSESFETRFAKLTKILQSNPGKILVLSETIKINSLEKLKEKFAEYVEAGLEGLIAKDEAGEYKPGTRNFDWIKLKVRAQSELADSIDAVVLGYYKGMGVRAKFGIGAILVGILDENSGKFVSVAKVGTGFKDADWPVIKAKIDERAVASIPENVVIDKNLLPDVLCLPELVVVVEADEVSKSKIHGYSGAGYSLRFPRFKYLRTDKSAEQATTAKEVEKLYRFGDK